MEILANVDKTVMQVFNIGIGILLFVAIPAIITLACKYNKKMDDAKAAEAAETDTPKAEEAKPEVIEAKEPSEQLTSSAISAEKPSEQDDKS